MENFSEQRQMAMVEQLFKQSTSAKRKIWVTFQRAGFHRYPAASEDPKLSDVSYLGSRHRHLFKFRVEIEIFHNDRELEFHQVLNYCESLYKDNHLEIDYKSVEMLADDLYLQLANRYPGRYIAIEVSEDGECGCRIEYNTAAPSQLIKI
jgi:hypothetical protein